MSFINYDEIAFQGMIMKIDLPMESFPAISSHVQKEIEIIFFNEVETNEIDDDPEISIKGILKQVSTQVMSNKVKGGDPDDFEIFNRIVIDVLTFSSNYPAFLSLPDKKRNFDNIKDIRIMET